MTTKTKIVLWLVFCIIAAIVAEMRSFVSQKNAAIASAMNLRSIPDESLYQSKETFVLIGDSFKKMGVGRMMVVKRVSDERYINAVLLAERMITSGTRVRLMRVTDRSWLFHDYDFLAITEVEEQSQSSTR